MDTGVLSSLFWFIAIGALFYWMMRKGGCGGHAHGGGRGGHAHGGGHGGHGQPERPSAAPVVGKSNDPVCGMEIDTAQAAGSRQHAGETFYFCSQDCLDKFDKNPMAYKGSGGGHGGHRHGGCC